MIDSDPVFEFSAMSSGAKDLPQFLTVWSLSTILRCLSPFVEDAERAASSRLNLAHVRKIAKEWNESLEPFSPRPLVIAVKAPIDFMTAGENPNSCAGTIRLRNQAILGVVDGLHRIAGLAATKLPPAAYKEATWPVQFIQVKGSRELERVNRHFEIERKPQPQKARLLRERKEKWTRDVIASSEFLSAVVAKGKSSLSKRSAKLWTESAVVRAIRLHSPKSIELLSTKLAAEHSRFWDSLPIAIPILGDYLNGGLRAADLRSDSVLGCAAIIAPLAQLGSSFADLNLSDLKSVLTPLSSLDWATANPEWNANGPKAERERAWGQHLVEICTLSKSVAFPKSTDSDHAT